MYSRKLTAFTIFFCICAGAQAKPLPAKYNSGEGGLTLPSFNTLKTTSPPASTPTALPSTDEAGVPEVTTTTTSHHVDNTSTDHDDDDDYYDDDGAYEGRRRAVPVDSGFPVAGSVPTPSTGPLPSTTVVTLTRTVGTASFTTVTTIIQTTSVDAPGSAVVVPSAPTA